MNKFVVVVFSDEARAYEGVHALEALHVEGTVSVYGIAVLQRETKGGLSVQRRNDEGPLGLGIGALVGGLVGVFGGPVGAAAGPVGGGLVGGFRDYLHAEVSDEFIEALERELPPGKFALAAEVSEERITPIDARMGALGGKVVREWRQDFFDDLIKKRVDAANVELAQRRTERAGAEGEGMESKMTEGIDDAEEKLQRTAEKARKRLDHTNEELGAKLGALEEQAAKARPEVQGLIEQRILEIRKEFGERRKKLSRAYALTQQSIHP
jgi:uncharacterized membrane protein